MFNGVYIAIDFKSIDIRENWFACCVMAVMYPTGIILDTYKSCHEIKNENLNDYSMPFWRKNQDAMITIFNEYPKYSDQELAEKALCQYIIHISKKYPYAFFISDNPQYDIRLLDNILVKNGYLPISLRTPNAYLQTICTWSFRKAVSLLSGLSYSNIISHSEHYKLGSGESINIDGYHTPCSDCYKIIIDHFCTLDFIKHHSRVFSYNSRILLHYKI